MFPSGLVPPGYSSDVTDALPPCQCFLHANGVPSWDLMKALRLSSLESKSRRTKIGLAAAGLPCDKNSEILVSFIMFHLANFNYSLAEKGYETCQIERLYLKAKGCRHRDHNWNVIARHILEAQPFLKGEVCFFEAEVGAVEGILIPYWAWPNAHEPSRHARTKWKASILLEKGVYM